MTIPEAFQRCEQIAANTQGEAVAPFPRFKVHSITERSYTEMAGSCKCEVWKFVAILEAVK